MSRRRDAEDELARLLTWAGGALSTYERQHAYVPGRKFAADFAWPAERLLVEIQGGIYTGGAHGSVTGIKRDLERLNLATLHGWRLLRFAPDAVLDDGEVAETLSLIQAVLVGERLIEGEPGSVEPVGFLAAHDGHAPPPPPPPAHHDPARSEARPSRLMRALNSVLGDE